MEWLDSLRELDLVAKLRELDLMAKLREVQAQLGDLVNGAAASDWLRELSQQVELREWVATAGVDANQLAGLAVTVVPLAWWLMYCWRIWNRPGRRGRGIARSVFWGVMALVAGTVRVLVIMLVATFTIVMLLGRLDGAGRSYSRW